MALTPNRLTSGASRKQLLLLVLVPLIALLLVLANVAIVAVLTQRAEMLVEHSDQVLEQAEVISDEMSRAIGAQRLYLLGGEPNAYFRYRRLSTHLPIDEHALELLVQDNAEQARRAHVVGEAMRARIAAMAVSLANHGRPPEKSVVGNPFSLALRALTTAEQTLRSGRRATLIAQRRFFVGWLVLDAVGGIGLTLWLYQTFSRRLADRLERVSSSTKRFARGEEPLEPLEGDDELAAIDRQFHAVWELLRAREEAVGRYRMLAEQARDIILFTEDGIVVEANAAALTSYGYSRDKLIGKALIELRPPELQAELRDHIEAEDEGVQTFQTLHQRSDGSTFPVEVTVQGKRAADGTHIRLAIVRDSTERIAYEQRLKTALAQANEASRLKSEFLSTMSHEIRTPMNGILGMTELLLQTPLSGEQHDYATTVRASSETLMRILNDILDFGKLEAGALDIQNVDFDLTPCVESVATLLLPEARGKGLALSTFVDPQIPVLLQGDPLRILQVLTGVVGNAIKFPTSGSVIVSASLESDSGSAATVRFNIKDTGIGIAPETQRNLFEAFRQGDGSHTRRYGGTGIGLAISNRLVELMGGTMGVESTPGAGSNFWFRLRLPVASRAGSRADSLQGIRALVADGDDFARGVAARYLMAWGVTVEEASNGAEALHAMERRAKERAHDFVIVDFDLPDIGIFDFVRSVRRADPLRAVPLLLTSASDVPQRGREAIESGFAAYLLKPLRQSPLFDSLVTTTNADQTTENAIVKTPTPVPSPVPPPQRTAAGDADPRAERILIVEDNLVNQRLAMKQLTRLGFSAKIAENGRVAVEALRSEHFDLVLMDLQMPEMDGFTATRLIRKDELHTGRHVPIIAVTADARPEDRIACLASEMDDYLSKPVSLESLRDVLQRWMTPRPPAA
ncbi:MAG TPA: response regulator [Candidatus Baltobacteraceae bacterium]